MDSLPKTLLITPYVPMEVIYGSAARGVGAVLPPLGILYLKSTLHRSGRSGIEVLDANVLEWGPDKVMAHVRSVRPRIVGLTSTTLGFPYAVDVAKAVRAWDPTVVLVFGGAHAIAAKDDVFRSDPGAFDYVCYGEGEVAFESFMSHMAGEIPESQVKGMMWMRDGALVTAPEAVTPMDLDGFGHPAEHVEAAWVPRYHEKVMAYKFRPMFALYASRGCPFKCTFCSSPALFDELYGKRVRQHSVPWILDEVRILQRRFGVREAIFVDDTFNLKRSRVLEFCASLARERIDLSWTCNFEAHIADRALLRTMKDGGCWGIMIGAESGDPQVLKDLKKGIEVEDLSNLAAWCEEVGIASRPSFILGTPTDTPESIRRTIEFAVNGRFHFPYFQLYVPLPGTEMFEMMSRHGEVLVKDRKQMAAAQVNYVPKGLDPEFLARAFREAHLRSYLNAAMWRRHLRMIRTPRDAARYLKAGWAVARMAVAATNPRRLFEVRAA